MEEDTGSEAARRRGSCADVTMALPAGGVVSLVTPKRATLPVEGGVRRSAFKADETCPVESGKVVSSVSFAEGVVSGFLVLDFLELRASEWSTFVLHALRGLCRISIGWDL